MKFKKTFTDTTKDRTYFKSRGSACWLDLAVFDDLDTDCNAVMIIEDDGSEDGGEILAVVPNRQNLVESIQRALEQELS